MVKRLIFLCFLFPFFLFSGEFIANVNRNQMGIGESFTLTLTLKGAYTTGAPSVDALRTSFVIHSQQQSFNTVMVNGQFTASTTWKLTLIPQKEGEMLIPSLSVDSSEGVFSTQPITISVVKGNTSKSTSSDSQDLTLTADISTIQPYKNEPIIYTIRLTSKRNLANLQMQKFNVEDAIVEPNGEPKMHEKTVNGMNIGVVEFSYLITPLKAGPLKIPSTVIQGGIVAKRNARGGSYFDDDFDLFSMMSGFNRLEPFALSTEEITLDVQPAIAGMNPWIPAKSLKIEEIWNESQSLQAGEPFTRSFKIVADGIKANQLPNLNELQTSHPSFKIYADKPELSNDIKGDRLKSYRQEQYTIIPQQAGTLTLPEISVAWWDVTKKEKAIARIPARTLQVLPAPDNKLKSVEPPTTEDSVANSAPQIAVTQRDPLFYALIVGLSLFLFAAIGWGIALQRKISRLTEKPAESKTTNPLEKPLQQTEVKKKPTATDKKEKLPDLNPT